MKSRSFFTRDQEKSAFEKFALIREKKIKNLDIFIIFEDRKSSAMVLATEIMMPPRRNSFNAPEPASKSPPKSHWWFLTSKLKPSTSFGGSNHTVAIQKLRESKWFEQDEERLFCAVIESGFIVEIVQKEQSITEYKSHYGVVSVEAKKSEFIIKQISVDIFLSLIIWLFEQARIPELSSMFADIRKKITNS